MAINSVHSPTIIAKARELGITPLQAYRHEQQRQHIIRRFARNPMMLLQTEKG